MDHAALKRKLAERLRQDDALRVAVSEQIDRGPHAEGRAARGPLSPSCEIAVVGLHCRFPGSDTAGAYIDSLLRHERHVSTTSGARWGESIGGLRATVFGGIDGAFDFDNELFRISPREAEAMDPHHRVLLESTSICVEDAGYAARDLAGTRTGVFVAMYNQDFAHFSRSKAWEPESRIYLGTGNTHCLLPNRISYLFDLRGPSEIVDTACSSSIVALHRAVQAIRADECDQAIVGAVSLLLDPERIMALQRIGILSPDGRCALFDAGASGQVMGEGLGTVMLKRKADALSGRDHIYGIIRASGVGHRGRRSGGLARPDVESQVALIDEVYRKAGLSPSDVSYIEAHGNGGTGDITEMLAFQRRFERGTSIGSAKANIGCLEAAGGLAQIAKVLMAMERGVMPATVSHTRLPIHDDLRADATPVLTENRSIEDLTKRPGAPFMAAIHAYGIGGVNAHVVMEAPAPAGDRRPLDRAVPILITGRNPASARQLARQLSTALDRTSARLDDVGHTLALGRVHHEHRHFVLARTVGEAKLSLDSIASGGSGLETPAAEASQLDVKGWLARREIDWRPHFPDAFRCSLPASPMLRTTYALPSSEPRAEGTLPSAAGAVRSSATLEGFLRDWLVRQCRLDAASLDVHAPLADHGVDSVTYVDLCAHVEHKLGVPLSPVDLSASATIAEIASSIRARIGFGAEADEILSRVEPTNESGARVSSSLKERERLFQQQTCALREVLSAPVSADLARALEPCRERFEVLEDARGSVWIFLRTDAGNTFDLGALRDLLRVARALRDFADFGKTKIIYFTHAGAHFSLGGHRSSFVEAVREGALDAIVEIGETYKHFLRTIEALPCVTVGVAYGSAQGGGMELLMAMDHQVVWPGVKLGFPEIKSGLIAGMGGLSYVAATVGSARAMRINLSGALISSEDALASGLISHVSDNPFATAMELGESPARTAAALVVRGIVNRRKYPLLIEDIDAWVSFVCGGALLASEQKILDDFRMIGRHTP